MVLLATQAGARAAEGLLPLVFLFGVGYVLLLPFARRVGGKGGGSEKASVGAWWLVAAIVLGVLVATE